MHQTIFQKRIILAGLRQRSNLATAEFYSKVGIQEPVHPVRFNVLPLGNNMFGVINRSTGEAMGSRVGHLDACDYARKLEATPAPVARQRSAMGNLAVNMLGWVLILSVVLVAFAIRAHR
ncbi:MAG: hypothetical protein ACOH2R_08350 [Pseudomonas sp.]